MLRNLFLFVPFLLLVHVPVALALPKSNGDYTGPCEGIYTYSDGAKYVGEYRDGLPNGQGGAQADGAEL